MKTLSLALGLSLLLFCVACGSGSSPAGPSPNGNFSNASLNGQYTYQFSGLDLGASPNLLYVRSGVFTANGTGGIGSGTDDFSEGTAISTPVTGSYSVSNDGTETLTLAFPTGSITFALTLASSSKVYMVESDFNLVGAGVAEKQTTSAFASVPQGTFAFRKHDVNASLASISSVGAMTVVSGAISGGEDVNQSGTVSSLTLTGGLLNAPDPATGRGTGSVTDSNGLTSSFNYYVVDANNLRFMSTVSGDIGLGHAELQTGGPFSNASISGSYAFGAHGDTANFFNGFQLVGRYTADGNGNLSAGAFDNQRDATPASNISFMGTYSVAANGRATVTTNTSTGSSQRIYWLVNSSRAFFITTDALTEAEGTVDKQTASSFSTSSMIGQYALVMTGFDVTPETLDRVATLQWDGVGHLTLNEFVNASGSTNVPGFLGGSYSVSSNGRVTGTINGLTNNVDLVLYLVSGNDAYVLQSDSGTEIGGVLSKQQ